MAAQERAAAYVRRADAALADIGNAEQIWLASVRTKGDENRLHGLSIELDNAIRKVEGKFEAWASFDATQVESLAQHGPLPVFWVVSSHPSGRVREAVVRGSERLHDDHILPHLANRALDFVPEIRQLAGPLVNARLNAILKERQEPVEHGVLPTAAHIAVKKLLMPRTAVLNPELVRSCIDLANTSTLPRPVSLREGQLDRMQQRCRQTLASNGDTATIEAIARLVDYFDENAISS